MEIVVTGRHVQVTDRFREHLEEKLAKVPSLAPKVIRVEVVVTHERVGTNSERVELTCRATGQIIRAEACSDDRYVALDAALDKLVHRLRRSGDRRKVARSGKGAASIRSQVPSADELGLGAETLLTDAGPRPSDGASAGESDESDGPFGAVGESPIEVREKVHTSKPMSLEDALNHMEMLGHDFFLFHDVETGRPSVVYRRRGWSYGVIHLDVEQAHQDTARQGTAHQETAQQTTQDAGFAGVG